MSELNRREFLVLSTTAACACMAGGLMCGSANAGEKAPPTPPGPVDIGLAKDLKDGVLDTFARSNQLMVIVGAGKVYACSSRCTHKGGSLKFVEGEFRCPNHGAKFKETGAVAKGPATAALDRFAISIDDKGHVIVDTSKRFSEANWGDPNASVKLPA